MEEIKRVYETVAKAMPAGAKVEVRRQHKFGFPTWDAKAAQEDYMQVIHVRTGPRILDDLVSTGRSDLGEAIGELTREIERRRLIDEFEAKAVKATV